LNIGESAKSLFGIRGKKKVMTRLSVGGGWEKTKHKSE